MFTGIIEDQGTVQQVLHAGTNVTFWLESALAAHLRVDQSVAHDGVCLTVEEVKGHSYRVTAIAETLEKTHLASWTTGRQVNLGRSLQTGSRLDGHFVQGHVDTTGTLVNISNQEGSYILECTFPDKWAPLIIEKGSIACNGISLTVFDVKTDRFKVAIIPYTWEHTNLHTLKQGDIINLEFDMIGKYIVRNLSLKNNHSWI